MEECCGFRNIWCSPRVEKQLRKPRPNLVMLRCTKRRSSFWRSRERMWVLFFEIVTLTDHPLFAIGESLSVFSFLYVECHLFHFLLLLTGTGGEQAVGHSVELHEVTVWTKGTAMTLQLLWRVWEDTAVSSPWFSLNSFGKHFQFW